MKKGENGEADRARLIPSIVFFHSLLAYSIFMFQAHPYLAPGEVLQGSQPVPLKAERDSCSQGFHSKICPRVAHCSHIILQDRGTQVLQA